MVEIVDFYDTLQVHPRAEPEVVRAAYRALAQKYHPDVASGSPERMVAINQAWAVLSDPATREAYDRGRSVLARGATAPSARAPEGGGHRTDPKPPGPPSGTVLEFGRYAGWSFGQIARHDPDFLEWFARAPIGRRFRAEIEELLANRSGGAPAATAAPSSRRTGFSGR